MNATSHLAYLPHDLSSALLVGRVWDPRGEGGPAIVALRGDEVVDITGAAPTMADLLDHEDPAAVAAAAPGRPLGLVEQLLRDSLSGRRALERPWLLAPCDLQAIKACGVTFATSLLERVIDERIGGDPAKAQALRMTLQDLLGEDISEIQPGSPGASRLKDELMRRGLWSQYLEVGIGPDAEVFSKSQPMSAVGFGFDVGLLPASEWNNSEPEIVLAVNSRGAPVGATLGNDVNLRDLEGRSALLLGKAKDNNGSCAIGPFIRLFGGGFSMDSIREAELTLRIEGAHDRFVLNGTGTMREISRDPLDLVAQTFGPHHQYPDGFMLFLGTMFSPAQDRGAPGSGFTHRVGDRVSIGTPSLGALVNTIQLSTAIPPWTFGVRSLYRNLKARNLL